MYYSWTWRAYKSESSEGLNISKLLSFVLKMILAGSSFRYIGKKNPQTKHVKFCERIGHISRQEVEAEAPL